MNENWRRPSTAAELARMSASAEEFGRNLRDWQHQLRRLSGRPGFRSAVAEEPSLMRARLDDYGAADAYLAAYVEWLCGRHGIDPPEWVDDPRRTAERAWYDYPPFWQDAFVHAPGAFRRRAVFTRPEDPLVFRRGRPKRDEAHKRKVNAERQRRYRARIRDKLNRLDSLERGNRGAP